MAMTRENSLEPVPTGMYGDQAVGSMATAVTVDEPMGSLYEVTRLRNIRSSRAKMVRPPRDGRDELDDFISKGVISEAEAEGLYKMSVTPRDSSSSMFSRYHSVDDVRAPCIAAFWLSEVSWKLSGQAIRIATELNIRQSFARALDGDHDHKSPPVVHAVHVQPPF